MRFKSGKNDKKKLKFIFETFRWHWSNSQVSKLMGIWKQIVPTFKTISPKKTYDKKTEPSFVKESHLETLETF